MDPRPPERLRATLRIPEPIRHALLLAIGVASLLPAGCSGPAELPTTDELRAATRDVDVVVVLLDAAAAAHFSFLGYERETTPHLDAVAARAVVFENAYAQASATPLSVYSMMTSRYPLMQERERPTEGDAGEMAAVIPRAMPTLAVWMAQRYDHRAAFTANHWIRRELGFDLGFGHFEALFEGREPGDTVRATEMTDAFLDWVDGLGADDDYFAYLHYLEPHEPYTPPEPFASRFEPGIRGHTDGTLATLGPFKSERPDEDFVRNTIALYDGNLAYVDDQIGRLVRALRERGRWRRTVFVLVSDHGEAFWQHGVRGHGTHAYEEFVRVPFLLRVPELPGLEGVRVGTPVELIDLAPTLLDLLGMPLPSNAAAGHSLLAHLTPGPWPDPPPVFVRNHDGGRWEYGIRQGPYKYLHNFDRRDDEFFDLARDPGETYNRWHEAQHPPLRPIAEGLYRRLAAWVEAGDGVDDGVAASATGVDSLDADAREALKALGYFH